MIRKSFALAVALATAATLVSANQESRVVSQGPKFRLTNLGGIRVLKDCTGKTDYPHLSRHVPGTVNVEATIKCPGREVTIVLSLTRITLHGTKTVYKSKVGDSKMTINVAMQCTWKNGIPFRYVASAVYTEVSGAHAQHVVYRDLNC